MVIFGHVQGVFFRQSTKQKAEGVGVRGWVRNRTNGTVEVVAEGSVEAVDSLASWCQRGPEMARVDRVERVDEEPAGLPEGFDVRPTI
ncbi:MAG: acylphosphatase [Myxococcota bacterium]